MSDIPTLNGQTIGEAERATRALLDRLLDDIGIDFLAWVPLNVLVVANGAQDQDVLVVRLIDGLKIDEPTARNALDSVVAADLAVRISGGDGRRLELTDAGGETYRRVRDGIDAIAQRLYGGLPPADLATAHRVLTAVTDRANAELTTRA